MTKALTGEVVDVKETISSFSDYKRHEIELGIGSGPVSKWNVFKKPLPEVKLQPKSVLSIAYRYHFNPYFGLGLRWTSFRQEVEKFPILSNTAVTAAATRQQTLTINCNALSMEGRLNFIRGIIEPFGSLSLAYASGNIGKSGVDQGLSQLNFNGLTLGIGFGVKINITKHFGTIIDWRAMGGSMNYKENIPVLYLFNGDKFDASYSAAFLILFYQF